MPDAEYLYGRNAIRESLRAARRQHYRLTLADGIEQDQRVAEIVELARDLDLAIDSVSRGQLNDRVQANHQGMILETSFYPYVDGRELKFPSGNRSMLLALDGIEDPRNVGSLLRTAEAIGIDLIVIPVDRAASLTPAVVNASAGATEHLRVARETNMVRWLQHSKQAGYWVVGLEGSDTADNLFDADIPMPAVLVVGSEGHGLRRLTIETCDLLVSIPMYGAIESLNAATAGAIALYQIREYSDLS